MSYLTLFFILTSVFPSVVAQILLKHGMSNGSVQAALDADVIAAGTLLVITGVVLISQYVAIL